MAKAILTISSKNYSSWCLRGWLMAKWAGLDFEEKMVSADDPSVRRAQAWLKAVRPKSAQTASTAS